MKFRNKLSESNGSRQRLPFLSKCSISNCYGVFVTIYTLKIKTFTMLCIFEFNRVTIYINEIVYDVIKEGFNYVFDS
jgi:hypothetical protein